MRVPIWAKDFQSAAELAATMNLRLNQWDYAGKDRRDIEWADVGKILDAYETLNEQSLGYIEGSAYGRGRRG